MTNMEEREKRAKTKATIVTGIMALIMWGMLFVALGIPTTIVEKVCAAITFFIVGFMCYLFYILFIQIFSVDEKLKESKRFAERVLSSKVQTEVVPIENSEKDEFICGLTNIAKFYAIITEEDKIKISVKFNNENKLRKLRTISKEYFREDWKLPEESKIRK